MKYEEILVCFALLISSPAWADWMLIVIDEEGTRHFIDPKTIRKEGSRIKVWELQDFKTGFRGALSMRFRMEYDCKNEQNKMLSISSHSGGMGRVLSKSRVNR